MPENWLTNEAISNYIVFVVGVIVALIGFAIRSLIQKNKPSVVMIEKEKETSLLDIAPEARGLLQVTYNNDPISEFYETTYTIFNSGESPLENIELGLVLGELAPEDTVTFTLDAPTAGPNREVEIGMQSHIVALKIPFLNPRKQHNDYVQARLYSSKPIADTQVTGGGVGWSVMYRDRVAYKATIERIIGESSSLIEVLARLAMRGLLP